MTKGKFILTKSKSGKIHGFIEIESKKYDIHENDYNLSLEMNNQECDAEIIHGNKIASVIYNSQEIMKNPESDSKATGKGRSFNRLIEEYSKEEKLYEPQIPVKIKWAQAPYNFVTLNDKIVTVGEPRAFNVYNGNNGYIELEIETKSPVYIRSEKGDEDPGFYQQAGKYRIPGSSLRGMIRTLIEITSWSKFGFFDDKYLYYRTFADVSNNVKKEYCDNMIPEDESGSGQYSMESGLLYKNGLNYYVIPEDKRFEKIKKPVSKRIIENKGLEYKTSEAYLVEKNKYIVVPGKKFRPEDWNKQNDWMVYADINQRNKSIKISEDDILSYLNDKNRDKEAPNLLDEVKKNDKPIPCFYVEWIDKDKNYRISFGHTPLFRLSYKKSIAEHINQKTIGNGEYDLVQLLFGIKNKFASRLFFEDCLLQEGNISDNERIPQSLMTPNPTSFQLYLDQSSVEDMNKIKHYNNEVNIRGNKLYWHKENPQYQAAFNPNFDTKIIPIDKGTKFKGIIRFENLTDIELGALLFALDLPKNCCHKIGMGKPIGLGSIKIKPELYLSNREKRYKNLFEEWDGIKKSNDDKVEKLKKKFEQFILNKINNNSESLWETERLKELKAMLDFDNKPADCETNYMDFSGKGFSDRRVLPRPTEVKKKVKLDIIFPILPSFKGAKDN